MVDTTNDSASGTGEQTGNNAGTESSNQDDKTTFIPPKDGSWIPRERMNEVKASKDAQIASLQAALAALTSRVETGDVQKPKTRAELAEAVTSGKMTQVQAADIWEAQRKAEIEADVLAKVEQRSQAQSKQTAVQTYEQAIPALKDPESVESRKLAAEHRHLVAELGLPNNDATVLAALRASFGPVEAVRPLKRKDSEPYAEGGGDGNTSEVDGVPGLQLTNREKDFYGRAIKGGLYKDWNEVKAERASKTKGR